MRVRWIVGFRDSKAAIAPRGMKQNVQHSGWGRRRPPLSNPLHPCHPRLKIFICGSRGWRGPGRGECGSATVIDAPLQGDGGHYAWCPSFILSSSSASSAVKILDLRFSPSSEPDEERTEVLD